MVYRSLVKGTCNFRDIGGYQADVGKWVRKGMVYRSDHLGKLGSRGRRELAALNIRTIVDMRSDAECQHHPTRLLRGNAPVIHRICLSQDKGDGPKALYIKAMRGKLQGYDFRNFMLSEYSAYVEKHRELLQIFRILAEEKNYPLLIHCNGGKDRTGFVVALIHRMLGVRDCDLIQDYMLSRDYMARFLKWAAIKLKVLSLGRVDLVQLKPVFDCRLEYLQHALEQVELRYGSVQGVFDAIGLPCEQIEDIKGLLLKS